MNELKQVGRLPSRHALPGPPPQETSRITGPGAEILVLAGTQKVDRESIAHMQVGGAGWRQAFHFLGLCFAVVASTCAPSSKAKFAGL